MLEVGAKENSVGVATELRRRELVRPKSIPRRSRAVGIRGMVLGADHET